MEKKRMLAADIGAGSGRLFLGAFDGQSLSISEEARYYHKPVTMGGDIYLDFLQIWDAVHTGICMAGSKHGAIASVSFDSFAPDFCLMDASGYLLSNMLSYRTVLGCGITRDILAKRSERDLFGYAGLQCTDILMLPQLLYLIQTGRKWMLECSMALPLVNALNFQLTGIREIDFTMASVSMLWDSKQSGFSRELVNTYLGFDSFLPPVAGLQSIAGRLLPNIATDGLKETVVINGGAHDTAMATYALDMVAHGQVCMNCGTWISVGVAVDAPVANDIAFARGLTNYGLPDGRYMLGGVMLGMFYLQKCKEEWAEQGEEIGFAELAELAGQSESPCVDLDDPVFQSTEESVLKRITTYFVERGMRPPATKGEIARCILNSLSAKCARLIRNLEETTGNVYGGIYIGGGGIKNKTFCQCLQQASKKDVVCVAPEITVLGNLLSQLIAQREIRAEEGGDLLIQSIM